MDQANNTSPYLSVVVTSRNDNHGGTLLRRMQIFTDCLIAQCKRHQLSTELIVVEWNPPADRGPLIEALEWPADLGPCAVRFITVPPEIHARYKHGKHLPLYQMIAKNVGIRRARGEFILATNIDVILNDELMAFIAQRKLEKGKMYRIDRTDADALVPEHAPLDEVLDYCRRHVLRVNAREGTFPIGPHGLRALAPLDVTRHEAVVSLGLGWYEPQRDAEGNPYRWVDNEAEIWLRHAPEGEASTPRYMTLDVEPGPAAGGGPFVLRAIRSDGSVLTTELVRHRQQVNFPISLANDHLEKIELHADHFMAHPRPTRLDPRRMSFMVRRIELSDAPPPAPPPAPPDIAGQGIMLGGGWFEPETAGDVRFRWLDNHADVWIKPDGRPFLEMDLEPGPSLDHGPFMLHVDCADGQRLQQSIVQRRKIHIPIPTSTSDQWIHLQLRIDGASHPVPNDMRILNARVFAIRTSGGLTDEHSTLQTAAPADIADEGILLGGWFAPETVENLRFRWLDNHASIWVQSTGRPFIELDLEPGPSQDWGPFNLHVDRSDGPGLERIVLRRQKVYIPMPTAASEKWIQLKLRIDGPFRPVPRDPRILNARVFGVRWTDTAPDEDAPSAQDVTAAGLEIGFGQGWHTPERYQQHWFRWADNDAKLCVLSDASPENPQYVQLQISRGPSMGKSRHPLIARDELGQVVARLKHATGALQLPLKGPMNRFTLSVKSPSRRLKNDPRILNFRVDRVHLENHGDRPHEPAAVESLRRNQKEPTAPASCEVQTSAPVALAPAPPAIPVYLHTNACGDFTLLHRDHWFELRGYAEWDVFSLNIDSLFCFTAHHGGAPETILPEPMRLYHIEHNVGSGWTPEGQQLLIQRIRSLGIPDIHWTEVAHLGALMNAHNAPILFCGGNWGLVEDELEETVLTGARSEGREAVIPRSRNSG